MKTEIHKLGFHKKYEDMKGGHIIYYLKDKKNAFNNINFSEKSQIKKKIEKDPMLTNHIRYEKELTYKNTKCKYITEENNNRDMILNDITNHLHKNDYNMYKTI